MDNECDNWNKEEAGSGTGLDQTEGGTTMGDSAYAAPNALWAGENQNQTVGDGLWAYAGKRPQERERLEQAGSRIWPGKDTGQGNRANSQNRVNSTSSQPPFRGQTPPRYTGAQQNSRNYGRKQYEIQYKAEYDKKPGDGLGIASLVLGILSFLCCCCSWIGISFGVLGILFAIMSKTEDPIRGYAKAGLIVSIVAISLNAILIILAAVFHATFMLPNFLYQ